LEHFESMGLMPRLVTRLQEQKITQATPIQRDAIPHALAGKDVMGLAQTGTGKTLAFGLPIVHILSKQGEKPMPKTAHGLVLAPTRELAKQIFDNLRALTQGSHIKLALVVGGVSINKQIDTLRRGVDLLIATPGRLIDLLDRDAISLGACRFLVLDEADQMLDMGFIHALRRIAPLLPAERQTMLFSATMPKHMAELSKAYLKNPVRVEVARPGLAADKIEQSVHFVAQSEKLGMLMRLLAADGTERTLVFARTKHGSERMMRQLVKSGFSAASIHGNKSQGQRDRAIREFKAGEVDILVATDVAARGIDIDAIRCVYNFDLPNVPENYVHRIGRTARAGADGRAVAFCAPDEMDALKAIQKVLGQPVPVASGRAWAPADVPAAKPKPGGRRGPKPTQSPRPKNNNRRRPGRGKGAGQRSGKAA